jgi:cytochrome c-type biogenesis protein CcmH/NrfG
MKKNGVVNRLTEVAARILLAKVYMTQKKFTEATTVLTPILKLGYLLTQR